MPLGPFTLSFAMSRAARRAGSLVVLALALGRGSHAQILKHLGHADAPQGPVSVVMLSDIHFEPFRDPAKLTQLREAAVEQWPAILSAPASPTAAEDFAALAKACPVHGLDTPWPLLASSLAQAAAQQGKPLFVTVSGDLLSHEFACRFKTLAPQSSEADGSTFAAKTVSFVAAQLRQAFPSSPVYLALGNNDSGCKDYREDRHSAFLQQIAAPFAAAARTGDSGQAILRDFSDEGDYNVPLPTPMRNARLIVLQNIFESTHYAGCNGKPAPDAQASQLAWLSAQLATARTHHQHVWVMSHVPPGVDMYSTINGHHDVCAGKPPVMFLESEKLTDVLTVYPDVIALAIFAHTHADEMRYLHAAAATAGIPAKLISSISPVNGNRPTFTVAQVSPGSAQMLNYSVFLVGEGAGGVGSAASASKEYSFAETYKFASFSAGALQSLTAGFLADTNGSSPASQAYQRLFFPGDTGLHAAAMQLFWRSYACSLREDKPEAYRACACPATASTK